MASNGLLNRAKKGKCRLCQRVRCTNEHVKVVGEVRHGFATGHIWQCKNADDCDKVIEAKLKANMPGTLKHEQIKQAVSLGRW